MYKFEINEKVKCVSTGKEGHIVSRTWENGPEYVVQSVEQEGLFYRSQHEITKA